MNSVPFKNWASAKLPKPVWISANLPKRIVQAHPKLQKVCPNVLNEFAQNNKSFTQTLHKFVQLQPSNIISKMIPLSSRL